MDLRTRMLFGRYKGYLLTELPDDYLSWLVYGIPLREPLFSAVHAEWGRRGEQEATSYRKGVPKFIDPDVVAEIIDAGKRTLALRHHPDIGGDLTAMQEINVCSDWLRGFLAEVFVEAGVWR